MCFCNSPDANSVNKMRDDCLPEKGRARQSSARRAGLATSRRAAVLSNITGMFLGLAGGCAFPPQQLPTFVRDHLTLKLLVAGIFFAALAAMLFHRKFKNGLRA